MKKYPKQIQIKKNQQFPKQKKQNMKQKKKYLKIMIYH